MTIVERMLVDPPPPFARPLLMLVIILGLLGGLVWSALQVEAGVDMRLFIQKNSGAATGELPTSLLAQSFYVTRPNLDRLDLQLTYVPDLTASGKVRLLEGDGLGGQTIYEAPLSEARFTDGIYLTVQFPPQADSQGRTYTLVLETPGMPLGNAVSVAYSRVDELSGGSIYLSEGKGKPGEGDLAIFGYYRYDLPALLGDLVRTASELRRLVLSPLLLLLLPGLALLVWLPNSLSAGQRLIAAPGMTALTLPVFFLIARAVGLKMNGPLMWALLGLCIAAIMAAWWRYRPKLPGRRIAGSDVAFWGLLAGVLFVTLVSRFLSLRDQVGGVGLDAYHHTLITRMFVEAGGIPADYFPYAPLSSFTYHYGFHSLGASIAWLSGRTSINDILLLMPQAGQIADTLPVLTLLLFGWKTLGNRWAGLAAGTLAGLFSVIPAFYVEWSRFTQGLGLALLPLSWVLLMEALDKPFRGRANPAAQKPQGVGHVEHEQQSHQPMPPAAQNTQVSWQKAAMQSGPYMLAVLGAAGLALTHYRITILYAVFVLLYLLWRFYRSVRRRESLEELVTPLRRSGTVAALAVLTLLPWLINLRQNFSVNMLNRPFDESRCDYYDVPARLGENITNNIPLFLLAALSLGGLAWAVKRRDPLPLLPALAWALVGVWSNPCWLPADLRDVTKSGYLDSVTVFSGAWLPLCLLAGYTLARFAAWVQALGKGAGRLQSRAWPLLAGGLIGALTLVGGLASGLHLAPLHDFKLYITRGDVEAMTWMREHIPRDSYVLAEPFAFPWSPDSVLGTDAGLWVPLVAGVRSSVPPMTAYNERLADPNYLKDERDLMGVEPLVGTNQPPDAIRQGLKAEGITHIYIGGRGEYFDKQMLLSNPELFTLLYHKDATWVFALN